MRVMVLMMRVMVMSGCGLRMGGILSASLGHAGGFLMTDEYYLPEESTGGATALSASSGLSSPWPPATPGAGGGDLL